VFVRRILSEILPLLSGVSKADITANTKDIFKHFVNVSKQIFDNVFMM